MNINDFATPPSRFDDQINDIFPWMKSAYKIKIIIAICIVLFYLLLFVLFNLLFVLYKVFVILFEHTCTLKII